MKRMKVRAADVKQGDLIFIEIAGCTKDVGTVVADAKMSRGFARFRIQYSEVYSGERKHFPNTNVLVER